MRSSSSRIVSGLWVAWHETRNIHFCTIRDFVATCDEHGMRIVRALALDFEGRIKSMSATGRLANILGDQGVFLLSRDGEPTPPLPTP